MWFYKESKNQQLKTFYCLQHYLNSFSVSWHMTTLQPKTTLSFNLLCFWFLLRCHVYRCWCTSIFPLYLSPSLFFVFLEETKTVYLPPANKSVLQDLPDNWKHEVSSMPGRKKKRFKKKIFLHTVRTPSSATFPPSQREQSVFVFTYVTHLEDLFTKRGRAANQKWGTCTVCV